MWSFADVLQNRLFLRFPENSKGNTCATARFTGDKLNTAVQNPAWVVTLWNFASLLYTSIGIYTNKYTDLLGFSEFTITV